MGYSPQMWDHLVLEDPGETREAESTWPQALQSLLHSARCSFPDVTRSCLYSLGRAGFMDKDPGRSQ